jgi:hypothetical protein
VDPGAEAGVSGLRPLPLYRCGDGDPGGSPEDATVAVVIRPPARGLVRSSALRSGCSAANSLSSSLKSPPRGLKLRHGPRRGARVTNSWCAAPSGMKTSLYTSWHRPVRSAMRSLISRDPRSSGLATYDTHIQWSAAARAALVGATAAVNVAGCQISKVTPRPAHAGPPSV